jgi:aconitate hydratase
LPHSIIVGGENYGQGSSREHAALLPMFFGVEAVIAKSFARIHKENLINYGILPLVFENLADYQDIATDDVLVIDNLLSQLDAGRITLRVVGKNIEFNSFLDVSDFDKQVLKKGGALNYLRARQEISVAFRRSGLGRIRPRTIEQNRRRSSATARILRLRRG